MRTPPLGQAAFNGILAGTTFTCMTGGLIKADAGVWPGSANILALTSISLKYNANLLGRALARNGGVTLDNNNVITLP